MNTSNSALSSMNKTVKKLIRERMSTLIAGNNPFIACDAARILLASEGVWVNSGGTDSMPAPSRITAKLTVARQYVYEELQRKGEQRRLQNQKGYIRRKIKRLKEQEQEQQQEAA